MEKTTVRLVTGEHCIQTSAKNEFRRLIEILLESAEDEITPVMAEQIKLLTDFLETSDFNNLRASDDRLSGLLKAVCILERDDNGNPVLKIND